MRDLRRRILAALVSTSIFCAATGAYAQTPPPVTFQPPPPADASSADDQSIGSFFEAAILSALILGTLFSAEGGSNTSSPPAANLQPWERNNSDGGGSYSSHEPDNSTGLYGVCHNPMGC